MRSATASASVAVGDQVALYYITHAARRPWAARGRPNISPHVRRMGVDVDGAFAEYVLRPVGGADPARAAGAAGGPGGPDGRGRDAAPRAQAGGPPAAGRDAGRAGRRRPRLQRGPAGQGDGRAGSSPSPAPTAKLRLARELGRRRDGRGRRGRPGRRGQGPDRRLRPGRRHPVRRFGGRRRAGHRDGRAGRPGRPHRLSLDHFRARAVDIFWRELSVLGSRGFVPDDIRDAIDLYLDGTLWSITSSRRSARSRRPTRPSRTSRRAASSARCCCRMTREALAARDPASKRRLGRSAVRVTELGFGGASIGELFVRVRARRTPRRRWPRPGMRDPLLRHGAVVRPRPVRAADRGGLRDHPSAEYALSTKVGRWLRPASAEGFDGAPWLGGSPNEVVFDYTYDGIMRSVEGSRLRLGITRFDVAFIHDLDHLYFDRRRWTRPFPRPRRLRAGGRSRSCAAGPDRRDRCRDQRPRA